MSCESAILLSSVFSGVAVIAEDLAAPVAEHSDAIWENELARRVHRDPETFMKLYEQYYERILNYLYRRTMNLDEAQDLTSLTFIQALDALRSREQRVAFRPWLYRIATNAHISHLRRMIGWAARVKELWLAHARSSVRTPRDLFDADERATCVRNALQRLPEKFRVPLILRFDEELSYDEIAFTLGMKAASARSRVARGLKLLQERMQRELR